MGIKGNALQQFVKIVFVKVILVILIYLKDLILLLSGMIQFLLTIVQICLMVKQL